MATGTIEPTAYFHVLNASGDCNDIVNPGLYTWGSSSPTHAPRAYAWMVVFGRTTNGTGTTQIVRSSQSGWEGYIWERHKLVDGTWSDWEQLPHLHTGTIAANTTTDTNGNVKVSNVPLTGVIAKLDDIDGNHVMGQPFIFTNGYTYLHVTLTNGTAVGGGKTVTGTIYWVGT